MRLLLCTSAISIVFLVGKPTKAQPPAPPAPIGNRIFFGGNFGASFSNSASYVDLSPTIGYRVNEKLSIGAGPIYQYLNIPGIISGSNMGARAFTRYSIWQNIFAQMEYDLVNLKYPVVDNYGMVIGSRRRFVGSLLVGGGISQHLGGNVSLQLLALYNLNQSIYSQHDPLYLSMGFGVGL